MKHYKEFIDKVVFESTYNIKLEDFDLYKNAKGINSIPTICDCCHQIFWINKQTFKKRLCYTEYYEKCFGDTWYCSSKSCTSKKKAEVCKIKMLQSEESVKKRLAFAKSRKGKSYEDQYGIDKATSVKQVIKQKRAEQPEPMLGKHHSDVSKLKMSLSKKELDSKGELNWINPITGKQCTYRARVTTKVSLWHKDETNRKSFATKVLSGQMRSWQKNKTVVNRWFDSKPIICQSTYEVAYANLLNKNKIYYDRCNFILPYKFKGVTRHYNPDIEIYRDSDCSKVTHIVEIKPKVFLEKSCEYTRKNLAKLRVLKDFCRYNNYTMVIITEVELNENKIY